MVERGSAEEARRGAETRRAPADVATLRLRRRATSSAVRMEVEGGAAAGVAPVEWASLAGSDQVRRVRERRCKGAKLHAVGGGQTQCKQLPSSGRGFPSHTLPQNSLSLSFTWLLFPFLPVRLSLVLDSPGTDPLCCFGRRQREVYGDGDKAASFSYPEVKRAVTSVRGRQGCSWGGVSVCAPSGCDGLVYFWIII